MAEHDCISEEKISKAQRRYKVGYVRARHEDRNTGLTKHYSQHPGIHLKGDWLKEAGFETGTAVTVKVSAGCLTIIADSNEVRELREELYQVKKVIRDMKEGISGVLTEV